MSDLRYSSLSLLLSIYCLCSWSVVIVPVLLNTRQCSAFVPLTPLVQRQDQSTLRIRREKLSLAVGPDTQQAVPSSDELVEIGRTECAKFFDFELDDWQLEAGGAICQGYNVIVCAPTGAGKTVVGEMALLHAFECGKYGIYTTPLKALSNQKYSDLCNMFGRSDTGLSTGDLSINKGARITVMTTEVYRNIAWRSSTPQSTIMGTDELVNNQVVVLDEFHYMGQPGRGGVWEECVITSPLHTQIVGLSATLTNSQALASWMESVTAKPTVLIDVPGQKRPVPLRYLFANKEGLYPLFRDPDAGPGSPKGLLGYSDDIDDSDAKIRGKSEKAGFSNNEKNVVKTKLPKGLEVNPVLKTAAERRLKNVERMFERKKMQQRLNNGAGDRFSDKNDRWDNNRNDRFAPPARKMSPRDERRERDRLLRNEMRRATPALHAVVLRLKQKNLLPAIFFIFSRVGCDEAARSACQFMKGPRDPNRVFHDEMVDLGLADREFSRSRNRKGRQRGLRRTDNLLEDSEGRTYRSDGDFINEDLLSSMIDDASLMSEDDFDETTPLSAKNWDYYSKAGLLSYTQIQDVASRISRFNSENPDIAFDEDVCEQFLFGVGSHHAGMLPAHKSFVEILYQNNLMKAVFATETLAAGINMPARTTVVCALAKRGGDGSSMKLLETSNLLQMAGRAGRRGMDTDGTCVIVATPFEGEDDAATILTSPVKPITSQFTPSYSLAVNLIARGEGRLDVAKQLVGNSFAMWERRQIQDNVDRTIENHGEGVGKIIVQSAQSQVVQLIVDTFQAMVDKRSSQYDLARIQLLLDILNDRSGLKKCSKSYIGAVKMLELEQTTLAYLEREYKEVQLLKEPIEGSESLGDLLLDDASNILEQIDIQRKRAQHTEKEVRKHPLNAIATVVNEILESNSSDAKSMQAALGSARVDASGVSSPLVSAEELSVYAKSFITLERKIRKLDAASPDINAQTLMDSASTNSFSTPVDSFQDVLTIVKTLVAFGCLTPNGNYQQDDEWEAGTYTITPAGANVGMIGFDNALWALVATGGAYDVVGASAKLDAYRADSDLALDNVDWYDNGGTSSPDNKDLSMAKQEAVGLVNILRSMSPAEIAGYVSGILADRSKNSGLSVVDQFQRLKPVQQSVVQTALLAMERVQEVQKIYAVDGSTQSCTLDISNCEVVTAWANGCTWNEALQISDTSPGDLARIISRVLDAVRQLGNLPFVPIRAASNDKPQGLHPEVRDLCRKAAQALNRYPVKDPMGLEASMESATDDQEDDDYDEAEVVAVDEQGVSQ